MLTRTFDLGVVKRKLLFKKGAVITTTSTAGVESELSMAEFTALDGATSANTTTGKAAILGTSGAITFGGAVTAVGSFIIGSADMSEADLEKLDGITDGTAYANKALVLGASKEIATITSATITTLTCTSVIFGSTTIDETDAGKIDGITNGTSAASKALVLDAAESLVWATTDATASETVTLSVTDTRTGAGATGWAIKGELATNASLGSYANGIYGMLNFTGSGGGVTGLGAGVCAEIVMSAGTGAGTYAALELELGVPTGGVIANSGTSFLYAQVYGDDKTTFDDSGYLLNLVGVTAGTSKMFMNVGTATALADFTKGLRVKVAGTDYVIPLITAAEFAS